MIIKIGTTEFARGTNRNEPCWVQGLDGSLVLNVVPLTRSEESGIYDQRNVSHPFSVTVTRHHDSASAACDYVFDHAKYVFGLSGDIVVESPSGKKWKLTSGKLEKHSLVKWVGKTTVHAYTIKGGTFEPIIA